MGTTVAVAAGKKAVVSGYTDATGDPDKNAELAKQRAFAVRDATRQAELLLARGTDTAGLQAALAPYAATGAAVTLDVWRQWISPGVIGPR